MKKPASLKHEIIHSLLNERWEIKNCIDGYVCSGLTTCGHPAFVKGNLVVHPHGRVFQNQLKVCGINWCIARAAKQQLIAHARCELAGNNHA